MAEFKVVEIFTSINGEGPLSGQLAAFIRLRGCNLDCDYCDTKWANQADAPYVLMNEEDIYEKIKNCNVRNVTLTGGEPLIQPDFQLLISKLLDDTSLHVEVETNGSMDIGSYSILKKRPAFTLDYKLPKSRMEQHMNCKNYSYLKEQDAVKFVCSDIEDLRKAEQVIQKYELTDKCEVYISPVFGSIAPADIVEYMKKNSLNKVRLQLQMHKFIWDPDMRGV